MRFMTQPTLPELLHGREMKLADLARACGVDKATVTRWSQKKIPADRLADVSRITGIPPHELRPDLADIFGPSPEHAA